MTLFTAEEKAFLLHLLNNRMTHPNQIGWVNPLDREQVFTCQEMKNLHQKVLNQ